MNPRSLRHLLGTPDYYAGRHADHLRRHGGSPPPPPYYLGHGEKYARRFKERVRPRMTPAGRQWLDDVLFELQRELEDRLGRDPAAFVALELDEGGFARVAFELHAVVYARCGVTQISLRDQLRVITSVDARDLLNPLAAVAALRVTGQVARSRVRSLVEVSRSVPGLTRDQVARLFRATPAQAA